VSKIIAKDIETSSNRRLSNYGVERFDRLFDVTVGMREAHAALLRGRRKVIDTASDEPFSQLRIAWEVVTRN
jgi:hypothetical protein